MLVLSYGITKSGSTLAFELVKRALINSGYQQDRLSDAVVAPGHKINFIESVSPERIEKLGREIGDDRIIVVKTHAGLDKESFLYADSLCAKGQLKVQVVFRDPRDVCLSMIDAGRNARSNAQTAFSEIRDMADAIEGVERQLGKLRRWGAVSDALAISYDTAAFDTDAALTSIESYLGISCDHESVINEVMHEAFTQKNKAVRSRHLQELSDADRKIMDIVFGVFLKRVCAEGDLSWFTDVRRSLEKRPGRSKKSPAPSA